MFTQAERIQSLYEAFGPALAAGHIAVNRELPAGVAVQAGPCGCREEECFFCGAEIDALWMEAQEAEYQDWYERRHCLECGEPWKVAYANGHCRGCGTCPGHPLGHVEWCTPALVAELTPA